MLSSAISLSETFANRLLAAILALYKLPGTVYIASYKEPLDQSNCWKLFVQLWNYTKDKWKHNRDHQIFQILQCMTFQVFLFTHSVRCTKLSLHHLPDVNNSDGCAVCSTISQVMGSSPSSACNYFSAGLLCITSKVTYFHVMFSPISYK